MDIDKELEEIFKDPLLNLTEKEQILFDIPEDMKRAIESRQKPDYIAQRKLCENFAEYKDLFKQVHAELATGKRSLQRVSKTYSFEAGRYYVVDGQMLLLEKTEELKKLKNGSIDCRTRCIYENGTESDIFLQTLRKNVVSNGYAVTETEEEVATRFFTNEEIEQSDVVTGHIYILSSLSENAEIKAQNNLYKIGFSTTSVEDRISNAENDPTYLMAPVKIEADYKVVNINPQKFEDLIHKVLNPVQYRVKITATDGTQYEPREWFVVPLNVIDVIIQKIAEGTITNYTYNPTLQCLEKIIVKQAPSFNTQGLKVLTLNIKKIYYDQIMSGEKTIEYRELKNTTLNKYTYEDPSDGKRYLRHYNAIRFFVGYHRDRESALVRVTNITFNEGIVKYHLGEILEKIEK